MAGDAVQEGEGVAVKPSEQVIAEARKAYKIRFGHRLPWELCDQRAAFIVSSLLEYIDDLSDRVRLLEQQICYDRESHKASRRGGERP